MNDLYTKKKKENDFHSKCPNFKFNKVVGNANNFGEVMTKN